MKSKRTEPGAMASLIAWCMRGETPSSLRAMSFSFTPSTENEIGKVMLRAHFYNQPQEEEVEEISEIETLLYSHEVDYYEFSYETVVEPDGMPIEPLEHMAWSRNSVTGGSPPLP